MRSQLWTQKTELDALIFLNTLQYAFEHCDPTQVLEETEFIHCRTTGRRIHPALAAPDSYFYDPQAGSSDDEGGLFYDSE